MLTLTTDQTTAKNATSKTVIWLFDITPVGGSVLHWSTQAGTFLGTAYTFSVWPDSFPGVTMHRSRTEIGALPMPEATFTATNALAVPYTASYFKKASVVIKLVINDVVCRTWKMTCATCNPGFKSLTFDCFGFLKDYMATGLLPNSPKITGIYPEYPGDKNDCMPVIFGTAYIGLPCVINPTDGKRYYSLGEVPVLPDYFAVTKVHAGSDWASPTSEWSSPPFTFDVSQNAGYALLAPKINDTYLDGSLYSTGFSPGGQFLSIYAEYYRPGTVSATNPADVISGVLQQAGIAYGDLSFGTAATEFNARSIIWNGGWSRKIPAEQFLCQLLSECNAEIDVRDKIYLRAISRRSNATISNVSVLRNDTASTWGYSLQNPQESDSGTVTYSASGTPNDIRISTIVAADTTTDNYSTEIFALDMVHDSVIAQKLAKIRFQRKYLVEGTPSWESPLSYFDIQPGDVVTISGDDYGGAGSTYDVIVDEMTISKQGTIKFTALKLSAMDDFDTLTFGAITPATPVAEPETLPPLIEAIHDPNKLTPTEKITIKRDFDSFTAEKSIIDAKASALGVSATSYDNAYTALQTALGTSITTALMDLETVIDGAAYRTAWNNYESARETILLAFQAVTSFSSTVRATAATPPTSGSGAEISYYSGSGYLMAYDRTNSVYLPLNVGGSSINFNASTGNYYFGTVTGGASAVKSIFLENGTAPTTDPVGGVIIWAEGGALKARGSSGTITTIAPA